MKLIFRYWGKDYTVRRNPDQPKARGEGMTWQKADEIQSSVGGIQLDTMFVDEGFGSLDDGAFQKAMQTMSQLGEGRRLVGVISHVAGLKERIDRQIIVKKDRSGGSRAEVVC